MGDDGLPTVPNAFQRLMLQWERFAPYNAGQFFTLPAEALRRDPNRAWRGTVLALGLQQIGQHPDHSVDLLPAPLDAAISGAMNRRFLPHESPLRPFAVSEGGLVHLGIVYRHVVADSASIRLVTREWFARLFGVALSTQHVTLDRRDVRLFDRSRHFSLIGQALGEFARLSRVKRVRRLAEVDLREPIRWTNAATPDGTIARLLRYARANGVSVNDLFVTAAAFACREHLPMEQSTRRRDLGVGTIVDTRGANDAARRFGLSLGFLQTFWRDVELDAGWDAALATTARHSRLARERRQAEASVVRLLGAAWHGDRLDDAELAEFYRKRCPLVAGISNVNLNRDWPSRVHPVPLIRYGRVSPTGPMLPIVFTPTTLGTSLDVGFTYRTGDVEDSVARSILSSFVARLESLGDDRDESRRFI